MPGTIYVLERKIHNEIIKIIFRSTGRINVAVSLLLLKIYQAMKECANLARCTAISNLPVAFKIRYKMLRTEIMPNYGIEFFHTLPRAKANKGKYCLNENCKLLSNYAACSSNVLQTFRGNISVPS
jgi:hypothetical protein